MMDERQIKREAFHQEIRSRQREFMFKMLRKSQPQLGKYEANQKALSHFKDLKLKPNSTKRSQLLKEIRNLVGIYEMPEITNNYSFISLLVEFQNDTSIDSITQIYNHQILLAFSSYKSALIKLKDINLEQLHSQNSKIVATLLLVLGNLLLRDMTFECVNYLIKEKHIFKSLVRLRYDNLHVFEQITQNYLWFSSNILKETQRWCLQNVHHQYQENHILILGESIKKKLYSIQQANFNELFVLYKFLLRTQKWKPDEQLLFRTYELFDPHNLVYLNAIRTILYYTTFTLPRQLLCSLVENLAESEDEIKMVSLHILINNLSNDIGSAPTIEREMIRASCLVKNQRIRQEFPTTSLVASLYPQPQFQQLLFQIIESIICYNGQLGVFEECYEVIVDTCNQKILQSMYNSNMIQ